MRKKRVSVKGAEGEVVRGRSNEGYSKEST